MLAVALTVHVGCGDCMVNVRQWCLVSGSPLVHSLKLEAKGSFPCYLPSKMLGIYHITDHNTEDCLALFEQWSLFCIVCHYTHSTTSTFVWTIGSCYRFTISLILPQDCLLYLNNQLVIVSYITYHNRVALNSSLLS